MNDNVAIKIDSKAVKSEAFLKAVANFFKAAKNVGDAVTRGEGDVEWFASVKEGSSIVVGRPQLRHQGMVSPMEISKVFFEGVLAISKGTLQRPQFFNDAALDAVRAIATSDTDGISILNNGSVATIDHKAATTVDVILGTAHKSFGQVEGKLSVLSDQTGFKFYITEPIHNLDVTCYITNNELTEKAVDYFRRRVSAAGLVRYRRNGTPISVDVDTLEAFEDDSALPSTKDVIGIYHRE